MAGKVKNNPTAAAPMRPTLQVDGSMAKKFRGVKPGARVTVQVTGVLVETGINTWDKRQPTARIEVHKIRNG